MIFYNFVNTMMGIFGTYTVLCEPNIEGSYWGLLLTYFKLLFDVIFRVLVLSFLK